MTNPKIGKDGIVSKLWEYDKDKLSTVIDDCNKSATYNFDMEYICFIVKSLQDTASYHSELAGYPSSYFLKNHLGWVLSGWHISLNPHNFDTAFTVNTWTFPHKKLQANRCFDITSKKGILAKAESRWLLLDTLKRKPTRLPKDFWDSYVISPNTTLNYSNYKQLDLSSFDFLHSLNINISENDIDTNNHTNNISYIRFALNALIKNTNFLNTSKLCSIEAIYIKESCIGDALSVNIFTTSRNKDTSGDPPKCMRDIKEISENQNIEAEAQKMPQKMPQKIATSFINDSGDTICQVVFAID